ncbi:MAG: methyltransferase domain-containing protein [Desulfobacteraceae bacterium]|nr:methyltransferase domain-containing protein [Desulfobacteraceae bacterium]
MAEQTLRENIELEPKMLAIGGKRLELLCVKNLEPFISDLEQNGQESFDNFPFWVKIWEASIVLTDRLVHMDPDKEEHILELGAGMGITGLFLGAFGYRVTITDSNKDALALIKQNAEHNGIDNVEVAELDWHRPRLDSTFDTICGSELVYRKSDVEAVTGILRRLLKPGGTAYLAHDISRMSMTDFLATAESFFNITHKGMSFTGGGEKKQIIIHTIRHKTQT